MVIDMNAVADELLTIGALANQCGVTVRTLRYYEEMDLIGPVKRSSGKYRLYNQRSLKRVNAILALQALNYTLEDIVITLGPYSQGANYSKADRILATRTSLIQQKDAIDGKLRSLKLLKKDIETRLQVIEGICELCLTDKPEDNCRDSCEYRDVHLT